MLDGLSSPLNLARKVGFSLVSLPLCGRKEMGSPPQDLAFLGPQFPPLKATSVSLRSSLRLSFSMHFNFAFELGQQIVPDLLSVLRSLLSLVNAILKFLPSIILFKK